MFPAKPPTPSTRTYKSTLQFLPHSLLLRLHTEARRTNDPDLIAALDQVLQLTASMDQAYLGPEAQAMQDPDEPLVQSSANPSCNCDDDFSYKHDLQCGHIVVTSTSLPTDNPIKAPCGPNCTRYGILNSSGLHMDAFSNISHHSFCCPVCVEQNVRKRYDQIHAAYSLMGWTPSTDREKNLQVWTHHLVLRCIKNGMRMAQGVDGIFKMQGAEQYEELKHELFADAIVVAEPKATKPVVRRGRAWEMRTEIWGRGRSESPASDYDGMFDFDSKKSSKYRERSVVRKQRPDPEIDDLADHLFDAKVALLKDDDLMENLLLEFGSLGTGATEKNGEVEEAL